MKKILFLLLLINSFVVYSQTPIRLPSKYVRQTWNGDTVQTTLNSDSVAFTTNLNNFYFEKYVHINSSLRLSGDLNNAGSIWFNAGILTAGLTYDAGDINFISPAINSGVPTPFRNFFEVNDTLNNATSRKLATKKELADTAAAIRGDMGGGSMVYPGVGIPLSTGSAWGTSFPVSRLDSTWSSIKVGTGNDTTTINTDGTIHQYHNGSQVFNTNTDGSLHQLTDGLEVLSTNSNGDIKTFGNIYAIDDLVDGDTSFIIYKNGTWKQFATYDIPPKKIVLQSDEYGNIYHYNTSGTKTIDLNGSTGNIDITGGLVTGDSIKPGGRLLIPMGEVSYFNTTGTTITISGTSDGSTNMVVVNPTTTLNNDMEFDNGGANNGRLRYTGATTRTFHIACSISFSGATTNQDGVFGIAKNGTVISASKVISFLGLTTDTRSTALHVMVELATNDYLELYVGNMTASNNVVVKTLNLFAMGM